MKVCLIGSTGHTRYVLSGLRGQADADFIGIAPGSQGEETDLLLKLAQDDGHSPAQFSSLYPDFGRIEAGHCGCRVSL